MRSRKEGPFKYEVVLNRMRAGETFTEAEAVKLDLCCRFGGLLKSIEKNKLPNEELVKTEEPNSEGRPIYRWGIVAHPVVKKSNPVFSLSLTEDQISSMIDGGSVVFQLPVKLSLIPSIPVP